MKYIYVKTVTIEHYQILFDNCCNLQNNTRVTTLDLTNNGLGNEGITHLSRMMSENTSVTELVGLVENQKQSQKQVPNQHLHLLLLVFFTILYSIIKHL